MTAPTPDLNALIQRLREVIDTAVSDSSTAASQMNVTNADDEATSADQAEAERVRDLVIDALAAVTAERDDARREVEHQKWIKAQNTAALVEQLDQARQMLADAPDGLGCSSTPPADDPNPQLAGPCDCWKAGL